MLDNMNGEVNGTTDETREVSPTKENDTEPSIQKETSEVENEIIHSNDNHCLDSASVHSDDGVKKCANNGELKNGLKNVESENSESLSELPDEKSPSNSDQSSRATTESDKNRDQKSEDMPNKVNGEGKSDDKGIINEKTDTIEKDHAKEDSIESSDHEKEVCTFLISTIYAILNHDMKLRV